MTPQQQSCCGGGGEPAARTVKPPEGLAEEREGEHARRFDGSHESGEAVSDSCPLGLESLGREDILEPGVGHVGHRLEQGYESAEATLAPTAAAKMVRGRGVGSSRRVRRAQHTGQQAVVGQMPPGHVPPQLP